MLKLRYSICSIGVDKCMKSKRTIVFLLLLFFVMSVTAVSAFTPEPTYYRGYSGESLKKWQAGLKENGYYHDTIDGIFGPATEKAVKEYQKHHSLKDVGWLGPNTQRLLFSDTTWVTWIDWGGSINP